MRSKTVHTVISGFVDNLGRSLVSFFFPPKCVSCGTPGEWLCRKCLSYLPYNHYQECLICGKPAIGGFTHPHCESRYNPERFLAPFEYKDPLRKAVKRAKYAGSFAVLSTLADQVSLWFEYSEITFLPGAILVPVPLHRLRYWERGYNQSLLLARQLARRFDLPVGEKFLQRVRYTRSQTRLDADERKKNVRGAFAAAPVVRGEDLVLVDDVATTGATLLEAARTLKRAGARTVWCLALSRGR